MDWVGGSHDSDEKPGPPPFPYCRFEVGNVGMAHQPDGMVICTPATECRGVVTGDYGKGCRRFGLWRADVGCLFVYGYDPMDRGVVNSCVEGGAVGFGEFQVPGDFEVVFDGSFDDLGFEEFGIEGDSTP